MDNLAQSNSKIYFNVLLFYENFYSFNKLREKYESFSTLNEIEIDLQKSSSSKHSIQSSRVVLNTNSFRLAPDNFNYQTETLTSQMITPDNEEYFHSYKKNSLESFSMDDTSSIYSKISLSKTRNTLKFYWVPKVILLVSLYPFRSEHSRILKSIYNLTTTGKTKRPLEKILENLILETPAPPRGLAKIEYQFLNEKYIFSQPGLNNLPLNSICMERVFQLFKIEQILDIYKHILLEGKVIFFSKEKGFLSKCIDSFVRLLYPLHFDFPMIQILPLNSYALIDNYESFIIGINENFCETFFIQHQLEIYTSILVVDIDRRSLLFHNPAASTELPVTSLDDLHPSTRIKRDDNITNLEIPKNQKTKLFDRIKDATKDLEYYYIQKEEVPKEDKDLLLKNLSEIFYKFLVSLFQEIPKYMISTDDEFQKVNKLMTCDEYARKKLTIYDLFKVEEFLNYAIYYVDKPFFKKLIETKMFYNFIYKKYFPKNNQEKLEVIYFDECIVQKNNKKLFSKSMYTPFILTKVYDHKTSYVVPKSRNFNEEEIKYCLKKENILKAILYGQDINLDRNQNGIVISYFVFPKLLYDDEFFDQNFYYKYISNEITFKNSLFDEVNSLSLELLSNPALYYIYSNTGFNFSKITFYSRLHQ